MTSLVVKKSDLPKISIVIPSYNQGEYIEETIISIIYQDYENTEIIIMDGGSTDNTIDIIKKYEKYISYWESKKDEGQADAINQGFSKATGEIFGWINSDDYYLPNYLQQVARAFKKYAQTDIVYGNSITLDERDGRIYQEFGNLILDAFLVFGSVVQSHTTFWRRQIHQPLDKKVMCAVDYELWLRLFPKKNRRHINKFGGVFRLHLDSKSMGMENKFQERWEADQRYIQNKHSLGTPSLSLNRKFRYVNQLYKTWCKACFNLQGGTTDYKWIVHKINDSKLS